MSGRNVSSGPLAMVIRDISHIDTSVNLFGVKWETPIVLCPIGSQKAFHPEGEVAVARAAKAKKQLQVLSTVTTSSVEDVIAALVTLTDRTFLALLRAYRSMFSPGRLPDT